MAVEYSVETWNYDIVSTFLCSKVHVPLEVVHRHQFDSALVKLLSNEISKV